jgi:hypothetical protein
MSPEGFWLIVYVVGYFVWVGYGLNRFISDSAELAGILLLGLLSFGWPVWLPSYASYRLFRWLLDVGPDRRLGQD